MAVVNTSIRTGGGGDYLSTTAWEADDGGGDGLGNDDCIGTCYNDGAFDEQVDIDFSANTRTITVESSERHDGTAGTGARVVLSSAAGAQAVFEARDGVPLTVSWVEIDYNEEGASNSFGVLISGTNDQQVDHTIIHDCGKAPSSTNRGVETQGSSSDATVSRIFQNIIYDFHNPWDNASGNSRGINNSFGTSTVVQNTIHNITVTHGSAPGEGIKWRDDFTGNVVRNNICTDCDSACFNPSSPSSGTVTHNLSSDGTASGTGSLTSKAAADIFVSTASGNEDLSQKEGAPSIDAGVDLGTTPDGVQNDIKGRDRDAQGDIWDMGAHESLFASEDSGVDRSIISLEDLDIAMWLKILKLI